MALEFNVPYKAKDYDAEFAATRPSGDKYDPSRFDLSGIAPAGLFSGQLFGDTFGAFPSPTSSAGGGLPAWFYGGALLIGGAVVYFTLKKKGR